MPVNAGYVGPSASPPSTVHRGLARGRIVGAENRLGADRLARARLRPEGASTADWTSLVVYEPRSADRQMVAFSGFLAGYYG